MAKGLLVLIVFPFTDLNGSKLRPAVILAESANDVMVDFITTKLKWQEPTDLLLQPSEENGLKQSSIVRTDKIATIDKALVKGILGRLSAKEIQMLDIQLKILLNLN